MISQHPGGGGLTPTLADYDGWGAMGFEGWGWDDVLPYFIRSEDNERGASELHGAGGPLTVSDGRSRYRTCEAFIEAAVQAGIAANHDFNGPEQDGAGWYQLTQRGGMRCSAAVAYLHPAMGRSNLVVETGAHVTRLLLDGLRAVGVEVDQLEQTREIRAEREVILSAGAYQSPQILQLSGIGPADDLMLVGIPAVHELPVGQGFQDHAASWITFTTDRPSLLSAERGEPDAATGGGARAADLELRRVRRVSPHPRRPRGSGHPAPRAADPVPRCGGE